MRKRCYAISALFGIVPLLMALAASAAEVEKTTIMVPMRDDTKLATDVYLPADWKMPMPVLLKRTPYNKNTDDVDFARVAARHGYAFVIQDMRGRFASEGEDHIVFHNDGWGKRRDGHDTLNWIAEQPWCNGRVATFGGSARGITQNMLAPGAPDVLKAQHVGVAFSNMYTQAAYQGGSFRKALVENWLGGNHFHPKSLEVFRTKFGIRAASVPARDSAATWRKTKYGRGTVVISGTRRQRTVGPGRKKDWPSRVAKRERTMIARYLHARS